MIRFIKEHKLTFIAGGILLCLLIIGTFFDLQISESIVLLESGNYYSKSVFIRVCEVIGEMPIYPMSTISLFFIVRYLHNYKPFSQGVRRFIYIISPFLALGLNFYGSYALQNYLSANFAFNMPQGFTKYLIIFLMSVTFSTLYFFIARLVKKELLKTLAIFGLIVIIFASSSQLVTQLFKLLFGRARYRFMNCLEDYSYYTPWYVFSGKKSPTLEQINLGAEWDSYRSFPSGHATSSFIVMTLIALPLLFENIKGGKKLLLCILPLIYTLTISLTRMLSGAHFLSDVTFGLIVGFIFVIFSFFIVGKLTKNTIKLDNLIAKKVEATI